MYRTGLIICILGFCLSHPNFSFSNNNAIKSYLPYDTVIYADFKLKDYPNTLKTFLGRFLSSDQLSKLLEYYKIQSQRIFDLDLTDSQSLSQNGIDLSHRAYFALFDFKIVDDFRPIFVLAFKLSDESKAKELIDHITQRHIPNPIIESENYKGRKIAIILREIKINIDDTYRSFSRLGKGLFNIPQKLLAKNLQEKRTPKTPNGELPMIVTPEEETSKKSLHIESFAYTILDGYLFLGTTTAIKKIIDSKYYRENLNKEQDFYNTIKELDSKALMRIYISYKHISPVFFTEFLDSNYGLGISIHNNDEAFEIKTTHQLNPDSMFYHKNKQLFTISPETPNLLDYLPAEGMNFTNWRVNLRGSLKALDWYWDFYILYGAVIYNYFIKGFSSFATTSYSLNDLLNRNAFDLLKDYVNNIGNDFSMVWFNSLQNRSLESKNPNVLFYSEVASKINGYKLINKLIGLFKQADKDLLVTEELIANHYFYTFSWKGMNLYLGLYNHYLMVATRKQPLETFLHNIQSKNRVLIKTFAHKNLLNLIKTSYFNFYFSFNMDSTDLSNIIMDHPELGFIKNLDYLYFSNKRIGDRFLGTYRLQYQKQAVVSSLTK